MGLTGYRLEAIPVRVPHKGEISVSARHVTFQITSNGIETTPDLANRSSIVRIRKQPPNYNYKDYKEGDLLDHIEANQPFYMGCVVAVIREWVAQGKQRTKESRHSFRYWARSLDWIVQNLFGAVPLMDEHEEAHARLSDPKLKWLRAVAIEVEKLGRMDVEIQASEMFEISDMNDIALPSARKNYDEKSGGLAVGRVCAKIFSESNQIGVDHFIITRDISKDWDEANRKEREVKNYVFSHK